MAGIAPVPKGPENGPHVYERKMSPARPGLRGPLRYEEGIATDASVPRDFVKGATLPTQGAPGHPNHVNPETQYKHAADTMAERMHPGSSAWVESPTFRSEFAGSAMAPYDQPSYDQVDRSGRRYHRVSPALITE